MAKCTINNEEFAYFDAFKMFKVIEKQSNFLQDAYIMSLSTGYPINVSRQRVEVIQYLKECQDKKETASIFTSKEALQVIF